MASDDVSNCNVLAKSRLAALIHTLISYIIRVENYATRNHTYVASRGTGSHDDVTGSYS